MEALAHTGALVIPSKEVRKDQGKGRKAGLNKNREGSVRRINGRAYVDFIYMGERVREPSGLGWDEKNAKIVREQLDKITVSIKAGTFRFGKVFPHSKKKEYFQEKEARVQGLKKTPDQVFLKDYISTWHELLKGSGRISQRTLYGYRSYLDRYLIPFFENMTFADLNSETFERLISWTRKRRDRKKEIKNESINKIFVLLKIICGRAAIEYGWGSSYNPFFGFKKLPEGDPYESIFPFPMEEQKALIKEIPDHWKPYFQFAFCSGLRQGEQIGLKPEDIDWKNRLLHIRRAITLNEDGKFMEGNTKNRYSRRIIKLTPAMYRVLEEQKKIYDQFEGKYFFCSTNKGMVDSSKLRRDIWWPALKKAGLRIRAMKQTRHSFATVALSCGESPLWIAKVMGHRNTEMIIKVYGKYVENATGSEDGSRFDQVIKESNEEK
jgi:integrase